MKTLIAYITNHGCAEKVAKKIASYLNCTPDLVNIRKKRVNPEKYDTVIIGGSIHAGKIQKKLTKFMDRYSDKLLKKDIALYICCMETGDQAQKQLIDAFPEKLRQKAIVYDALGGEFDFDKMNFLEKAIIKKVANVSENVSKIDEDKIRTFTEKIILNK